MELKDNKELIEKVNINDLINKIEKDPLPTNIFTTEDTDPLVLLGKLNEVIAHLKALRVIISESDSKATEALTKAIESLTIAQEAITTATTIGNEAKTLAQNALEQANSAHDTAGEALMEATDALTKAEQAITTATTLGNEAKTDAQQAISTATTLGNEAKALAQQAITTANEALSQVVQGLGTKVYDNHGNLLSRAKFTGHNGINVDMDETDPETFNIRLDNELVGQLEMTDGLIETIENEINNSIKPRLTSVESTASANASDLEGVHKTLNTQDAKILALETLSKYFKMEDDNDYFNFLMGDSWRLRVNKKSYHIYLQYKTSSGGWSSGIAYSSGQPNFNGEQMVDWLQNYGTDWVRTKSGFQICWGVITDSNHNTAVTYTATFPKPFGNTKYYVLATPHTTRTDNPYLFAMTNVRTNSKTTTTVKIYVTVSNSSSWHNGCYWLAIGKWK